MSVDGDGTVVGWDWDFGDGSTSSEQHPTHSYAAGGTYTVSLVAIDDDGARRPEPLLEPGPGGLLTL